MRKIFILLLSFAFIYAFAANDEGQNISTFSNRVKDTSKESAESIAVVGNTNEIPVISVRDIDPSEPAIKPLIDAAAKQVVPPIPRGDIDPSNPAVTALGGREAEQEPQDARQRAGDIERIEPSEIVPPSAGTFLKEKQQGLILDTLELLCPDGDVVYDQHPDSFYTAWTSDAIFPHQVFDDVLFTGYIDDIHFWGLKLQWVIGWVECIDDPFNFEICLYPPDDSLGYPDTLNPIACVQAAATSVSTGEYIYDSWMIYRWDIVLDDSLYVRHGDWISIQAGQGETDSCAFLWLDSYGLGNDSCMQLQLGSSWAELASDVALCLTGSPPVCDDAGIWDNGAFDGIQAYRPNDYWDTHGILEDVQLWEHTAFNCIRLEFVDAMTAEGSPSLVDSIRIRLYSYVDSVQELDWDVHGPYPVYDHVYTKANLEMFEYDTGQNPWDFDFLYWDLCGPVISLPAGNYAMLVNVPGFGNTGEVYWATATNYHGNESAAVWGSTYTTPSLIYAEMAFHWGWGTCIPLGACCVLGDCFSPMPETDCDDLGGTWYEGEDCNTIFCPSPECEDVIFDNGLPDNRLGLASDLRPYDNLEPWVVDDVTFESDVSITDLHWWCVTDQSYIFTETDEVLILYDDGGVPGDTAFNFVVDNVRRPYFENGSPAFRFGRPVFIYSIYLDTPIELPAGTYWFGMRPINSASSGQNFWLTSPGPNTDSEVYFRSDFFGYSNWTPSTTAFGTAYNVAFCITGELQAAFGACCDDASGICTDSVASEDCPPPLRFVGNTECDQIYPPCGETLGACCVDGVCVATNTQSECEDLSGFWYEGEDCDEFFCPFPGCDDAVYDNGSPDLWEAMPTWRAPGNVTFLWVVADFVLEEETDITDFHWWTVEIGFDWVQTDDFIIMNDAAGVPGDTVFFGYNVPNIRWQAPFTFYDYPVFVYTILLDVPITLPAGTYWLGLRPVGNSGESYWMTAPVTGYGVYTAYPTPWSYIYDYDVAFCVTGRSCYEYVTGDANMINGIWPPLVIGGDVTFLVNYFRGTVDPCLLDDFFAAADVNGDCSIIGSDVTRLVTYFRGLAPLVPCPDYVPCWPTPDDTEGVPEPSGWPNCD